MPKTHVKLHVNTPTSKNAKRASGRAWIYAGNPSTDRVSLSVDSFIA